MPLPTAVIFDMDGVISDTQSIHSNAEAYILQRYDINIDPSALSAEFAGITDKIMFETIFERFGRKDITVEEVLESKWEEMERLVAGGIKEIPGAVALISRIYNQGIPLAVASGSPLRFIERVTESLNIRHYFQCLVSADEVPNGKPAPDVFLEAARRLSVLPRKCIVIEDGVSGMTAAVKAEMWCVGLVNDLSWQYPAHRLVRSLDEITDNMLSGSL